MQTTIRLDKDVKNKLANLDFVRKQSYNDIIIELIAYYTKTKGRGKRR